MHQILHMNTNFNHSWELWFAAKSLKYLSESSNPLKFSNFCGQSSSSSYYFLPEFFLICCFFWRGDFGASVRNTKLPDRCKDSKYKPFKLEKEIGLMGLFWSMNRKYCIMKEICVTSFGNSWKIVAEIFDWDNCLV